MDTNNKSTPNGNQLLASHAGGIICPGGTDLDSEDDEEIQEKSYQTLSSVKYGEAPPHVLEAVRGLTASSTGESQFCPPEIFNDKSEDSEMTPITQFSVDTSATETVSNRSASVDPINCSFAYLNRSTSDSNTRSATISSGSNSVASEGVQETARASDQRPPSAQNSRKRQFCEGPQPCQQQDGPQQRKQPRGECSFSRSPNSRSPISLATTRSSSNALATSRAFKPQPNCWQQASSNADAPGVVPRTHWTVFHDCEREIGDRAAPSCNLTQTILVPDLSRPASCAPFGNSAPGRGPNPWPNFRPVPPAQVPWADESDGQQGANAAVNGEQTPSSCDQEIRNETFPMTRRYIIRNMSGSGSPANVFSTRSYSTGPRLVGEGVSEPTYPPVVQRPYAYPSVMPKSMQMLSRNVHFVNNYGMKGLPGTAIASSFKTKTSALSDFPQGGDVITKGLPPHISTKDVFCLVPGRLGMPNQSKRHEVLVGEILRRVLTPESLNISLLGPILRKAKSKNGTQYLREKLQQIGVELPPGRRKTAKCTLFTSLTESEASQLAEDFSKLCQYEFPAKSLAMKALQRRYADESPFITSESIAVSLKLLDCFIEILGIKMLDPFHDPGLVYTSGRSTNVASQLYNFETLTHGFGLKALLSSLRTFRRFLLYLDE